jgi:hypothetical protein
VNASELSLKATPFLAIVHYMNDRLPPAGRERVLARLSTAFPAEVHRVSQEKILATEWFQLRFATELIEEIAAEIGEPSTRVAYTIGSRGAEAATGTVLRFVFALISMPSYIGKIQAVWSKFYSQGRITHEVADRSAVVHLSDFPFVSAVNCARVTGSLEWFGKRAERTAVVRHSACRAKGDGECAWSVTW